MSPDDYATRPTPGSHQAGFSLVEQLVTIVVLAFTVVGTAPMLMATARQAMVTQSDQYLSAAMSSLVSRYGAMSFGSLGVGSTCASYTTASEPLPRTECVTIADSAGVLRTVTLMVAPVDTARLRPDTLVMRRVRTLVSNPLNAP